MKKAIAYILLTGCFGLPFAFCVLLFVSPNALWWVIISWLACALLIEDFIDTIGGSMGCGDTTSL
jgi:hypothetical protein